MFLQLLGEHFVHTAFMAGVVVAAVAGLIGSLVVVRGMAFSVHGIAELGLTGAAGGLLAGLDATTGALIGSVIVGGALGLLGISGRERDTATGAVLSAGLGLGVLFLSLYRGYATTGFGLLFGSITTVSDAQLRELVVVSLAVVGALTLMWRPLWFASVDPDAAEARGVPVRLLSVVFALLLGAAVAETIQVTGVLLVLTLVITPAAAAQLMTASRAAAVAMAVVISMTVTVGGILASLAKPWPASFFISMFSFAVYCFARLQGTSLRTGRSLRDKAPLREAVSGEYGA
ncbi:MAG: metal ABC transporter permease [Actinomycetota bacterium]|nr:metal ABC transporter permease [Actinomycetota bacterium]